ncbi:cytochrome c [Alteromonas sp. C1M14]|uniref:c-type cytochrome n=1 Tax=Alteromonas sp. C1M14 TaxID=2841567 RepID=UPI001C0A55B3|nr:cytochrome c [Alteromonas sp. C1M14]MBU2979610.1 cytochrome c [Alteromonas sp. C1M14]
MAKPGILRITARCAVAGILVFSSLVKAEGQTGEQVFTTCSACHLATGAGIPGAFPPLTKLPDLYAKEGGKDYLISVVLQGLSGPIQSQGTGYNGFMQAFGSSLTDTEIAAVLAYVLTEIASPGLQQGSQITASDVSQIREKIANGQWKSSHELRSALTMP